MKKNRSTSDGYLDLLISSLCGQMHLVAPGGQSHLHMICDVESPSRHSTSSILSKILSSLKNLRIRWIYTVFVQHAVKSFPWYTSPKIEDSTCQWAGYVLYIDVQFESLIIFTSN